MQTARDLMKSDVLTVPMDMTYTDLVHLLVVSSVHGVPVVDQQGAVVGVLSAMDLLRATEQAFDDERDEDEGADPVAQLRRATALQIASPEPTWATPETSIGDLARLMRETGSHRVLIGTPARLEGIVTAFDLLGVTPSS